MFIHLLLEKRRGYGTHALSHFNVKRLVKYRGDSI